MSTFIHSLARSTDTLQEVKNKLRLKYHLTHSSIKQLTQCIKFFTVRVRAAKLYFERYRQLNLVSISGYRYERYSERIALLDRQIEQK